MGKYATGSQTFERNLIMSGYDRNLKINSSYGNVQYVNNLHYNNYDQTNLNDDFANNVCINLVGNYWKDGPSSTPTKDQVRSDAGVSVYSSGNFVQRAALNNTQTAPCPGLPGTIMSANDSYNYVLANAGATAGGRDANEQRLVNEVKNGTGSIKDVVP